LVDIQVEIENLGGKLDSLSLEWNEQQLLALPPGLQSLKIFVQAGSLAMSSQTLKAFSDSHPFLTRLHMPESLEISNQMEEWTNFVSNLESLEVASWTASPRLANAFKSLTHLNVHRKFVFEDDLDGSQAKNVVLFPPNLISLHLNPAQVSPPSIIQDAINLVLKIPKWPSKLEKLALNADMTVALLPPIPSGFFALSQTNLISLELLDPIYRFSNIPELYITDIMESLAGLEGAELPGGSSGLAFLVRNMAASINKLPKTLLHLKMWCRLGSVIPISKLFVQTLPPNLLTLDLFRHDFASQDVTFKDLPRSLTTYHGHQGQIDDDDAENLPPNLTSLDIEPQSRFSGYYLPATLKSMSISYFETISELPEGIESLKLYGTRVIGKLVRLPNLPSTVTSMHLDSLNISSYVLGSLPLGLKSLSFQSPDLAEDDEDWPSLLPQGLQTLSFIGVVRQLTLQHLPRNLTSLTLVSMHSSWYTLPSERFAELPGTLTNLDASCSSFKPAHLSLLPTPLKRLCLSPAFERDSIITSLTKQDLKKIPPKLRVLSLSYQVPNPEELVQFLMSKGCMALFGLSLKLTDEGIEPRLADSGDGF
jgi:hypothetical protein